MSEFGFAYKLKSTSVDKRQLRLHRRSIEWKQNRDERLNSARNLESLSPLQEISTNASIDQSYEGKTPAKAKVDHAKANIINEKTGNNNKNEQQKSRMDRLAKWKAEKELKKKLSANDKARNRPFKVTHIDYKDLEKLDKKIKGSRIHTAKSSIQGKTFQPPPPPQSVQKSSKTTVSKQAKKPVSTKPVNTKQAARPVPAATRTKPQPSQAVKPKVPVPKVQSRNMNKQTEKKCFGINLQKVSTKRGESFAPEEFTFTAPANISSFVFKPLSPNAAASFLNPNQDPGASFIGTDPKRCSTPKSSDSVKKEMDNVFHQSQCEQTFKDNTDEIIVTDNKSEPRRSTRQSRKKSEASKTTSVNSDERASPDNKKKTRSSLRSQDRPSRRFSSGRRNLDRSGSRRLSQGSLDRSVSRPKTRPSTVVTPSSGRSSSSKRTRSDRDKDLDEEEQASKRSKSAHIEPEGCETVSKPVVNLLEQSATPRRRSTRIARKSLSQASLTPDESIKSQLKVMSATKVKETDESEQNDDVFENTKVPFGKQDKVESEETDKDIKVTNENIESTNVTVEIVNQTELPNMIKTVSTKTPSRRRKSVRRSLHSKTSITTTESVQDMTSSPKPLALDIEEESKENIENIPEKKLTRSTKRRSFSSVDFAKPSEDWTVLSAKRKATKKKRRKTVYDHTVVKSPEEWINLLKDSPMVEMNRRTPKVKTPPPPALDFDLTLEELEQYSPTKQLNFSTCESGDAKQTEENQPDTQMETNDVDKIEKQTTSQNYTAQELQVDEVSTTQDSDKIEEDDTSGEHDVPYFRRLLKSQTSKLNSMCQKWEDINTATPNLSEDVRGQLRTVVGQAQLLIAQRFKQFEGLVNNCEFKSGEKETTCTDLQGFWEMIFFQVEDVNVKFQNLDKLRANNWDLSSIQPKKRVVKKKAMSKPVIKKSAVKSKFAAFRAGMKNKAATITEDKTIDFGFFKVQSPVKNPSPHCAAGSPRQVPKVEVSAEEKCVDKEDNSQMEQASQKPEETQNLLPSDPDNGLLSTPLITPLKKKSYVPNIPSPLLQDITPQPRMTRSSSIRKTPLPKSIINDVDDDVIMDKNLTNMAKELVVTLSAQKKVDDIEKFKNSPMPKSPSPLNSVKNASEKKPRRRSLRTRKSVSFCDSVVVPENNEETTENQDPFSKYLQPMTPRMSMAPKGYSVLDALPDDSFSAHAEAGSDLTFSPLSDGSSHVDSPSSNSKRRHSGLKQLPTRERRRSTRKSVQFTSPKSSGDCLGTPPIKYSGSNSSTPDSSDSEISRFPSLNIGFTPVAKSARPSLLFTPTNELETSLSTTAEVPIGQLISFTP